MNIARQDIKKACRIGPPQSMKVKFKSQIDALSSVLGANDWWEQLSEEMIGHYRNYDNPNLLQEIKNILSSKYQSYGQRISEITTVVEVINRINSQTETIKSTIIPNIKKDQPHHKDTHMHKKLFWEEAMKTTYTIAIWCDNYSKALELQSSKLDVNISDYHRHLNKPTDDTSHT